MNLCQVLWNRTGQTILRRSKVLLNPASTSVHSSLIQYFHSILFCLALARNTVQHHSCATPPLYLIPYNMCNVTQFDLIRFQQFWLWPLGGRNVPKQTPLFFSAAFLNLLLWTGINCLKVWFFFFILSRNRSIDCCSHNRIPDKLWKIDEWVDGWTHHEPFAIENNLET